VRLRRYVCPSGLELFRVPRYVNAEGTPVQVSWAERHAPWMVTLGESLRSTDSVVRSREARAAAAAAQGLSPVCPAGHPLPDGYTERRTVTLGLVGLTGSGKSTLITSLVETLLRGVLAPLGVTVTMDEESASRYQVDLRRHLIVDRERIPPTYVLTGNDITKHPLVLRLGGGQDSLNLLIYDASGEQLYRRRDIAEFNPYLYHTSAIMLVLSPNAFPGLEHLDDDIQSEVGIAQATQMVSALSDVVRRGRRLRRGELAEEVAVAVTLTKADKLVGMDGFPSQYFGDAERFLLDHSLEELFELIQEGSDDIVEFLTKEDGENLMMLILSGLPRPTFHLVSATGHDVAMDGHYPSIDQVGVVGPLLTLLARIGFLPSEGLMAR
jgi:hypothetical protein